MTNVQPKLTEYVLDWYYGELIIAKFEFEMPLNTLETDCRLMHDIAGMASSFNGGYLGWHDDNEPD